MVEPIGGVVIARDGSAYRVVTPSGEVRAVLRGKTKRGESRVVVGDHVRLDASEGGETLGISSVEPRRNVLERRTPQGRGTRTIAANLDQVLVLTATRHPEPIPQLLDRLLVIAEANELPASVLINKIDLAPADTLRLRFERAGYTVYATSLTTGEGLEEVRALLHERVTVVYGPSGVGKSSLANALEPGLGLRVAELSRKVERGRQTTVSAEMIPMAAGGYLVDTPGFSDVGLWGVVPRELGSCFPEMIPFLEQCRFPDCTHRHEPGCAVRRAVDDGAVAADRYESYVRLREELESAPEEWE